MIGQSQPQLRGMEREAYQNSFDGVRTERVQPRYARRAFQGGWEGSAQGKDEPEERFGVMGQPSRTQGGGFAVSKEELPGYATSDMAPLPDSAMGMPIGDSHPAFDHVPVLPDAGPARSTDAVVVEAKNKNTDLLAEALARREAQTKQIQALYDSTAPPKTA
jgi:hypothetical protein